MEISRNSLSIGGKYSLSWPTLALYSIPSSWIILVFDQSRLGGNPVHWVLLAVVAYVSTVVPLCSARLLALPVIERTPRPLLAVAVFVGSAYIRSLISVPLARYLTLIPDSEIQYRILSSPLNVVFWMIVINAVVTQTLNHRDAVRDLEREQKTLEHAEGVVSLKVAQYRSELEELVLRELSPALRQLHENMNNVEKMPESKKLLNQLQEVLSNAMMSLRNSDISATSQMILSQASRSGATSQKLLPASASLRRTIAPIIVPAIVLYSGFVPTLMTMGWETTWLVFAPVMALFTLALFVITRVLAPSSMSTLTVIFLSMGTYGLCSLLAYTWLMFIGKTNSWGLQLQFTATVLAVGTAITLYKLVDVQREHIQSALRLSNEQLNTVLVVTKQRLWNVKRKLATILHGPIQAAIQSGSIRLRNNQEDSTAILLSVKDGISAGIAQFHSTLDISSDAYLTALNTIESLWGNICFIDINVHQAVLENVEREQVASVTQ